MVTPSAVQNTTTVPILSASRGLIVGHRRRWCASDRAACSRPVRHRCKLGTCRHGHDYRRDADYHPAKIARHSTETTIPTPHLGRGRGSNQLPGSCPCTEKRSCRPASEHDQRDIAISSGAETGCTEQEHELRENTRVMAVLRFPDGRTPAGPRLRQRLTARACRI